LPNEAAPKEHKAQQQAFSSTEGTIRSNSGTVLLLCGIACFWSVISQNIKDASTARLSMSRFKQARKYLLPALLIAILSVSIFSLHVFLAASKQPKTSSIPYVGIAFCGNNTAEAKLLIDRAKTYTNLFILNTARGNPISENQSNVEEICDYAVAEGLSIIINLGVRGTGESEISWFWQQSLKDIKGNWSQRWGNKFLGIYYNDEPGGIQLDGTWAEWFPRNAQRLRDSNEPALSDLNAIYLAMLDSMYNGTKPSKDYDLETHFYVQHVLVEDPGLSALKTSQITSFTSDYGLYWYDYLGGYDVMFAEAGWNCSLAQQIALVKGAARLQNKPWGLMITWKYNGTPYLDAGDEIYNQMLMGYQAGAKYIAIFNYPTDGNGYGVMDAQHFVALERFWNDIHQKSFEDLSLPTAALVLPHNYGWGMRYPNDTIWGFWSTDDRTEQTAITMSRLLARYGTSLDIIYEDALYPVGLGSYKTVYYWNTTAL